MITKTTVTKKQPTHNYVLGDKFEVVIEDHPEPQLAILVSSGIGLYVLVNIISGCRYIESVAFQQFPDGTCGLSHEYFTEIADEQGLIVRHVSNVQINYEI